MTPITIDPRFRHRFHLMPPAGWMNDPNGFCYFDGAYHLFYQHNPNASAWGSIHWGHSITTDFITWKELPIALYPDRSYDADGVFSGTAIEKNGVLHLFYTGHTVKDGVTRQVQCLATSRDGIHFEKHPGNPVVDERHLPQGISTQDFRDPKVFALGDRYVMTAGCRNGELGGKLLFFTSHDLIHWSYRNALTSPSPLGDMWECPDIICLDGQYALIFSPQNMPEGKGEIGNVHKTVCMRVTLEEETLAVTEQSLQIIDHGFDFYAPQTVCTPDGRRVLVAWMNMWERTQVPSELHHGWTGSMTLPRELTFNGGRLVKTPVRELAAFRRNPRHMQGVSITADRPFSLPMGHSCDLEIVLDSPAGTDISLFGGNLKFSIGDSSLSLLRTGGVCAIESKHKADDTLRMVPYSPGSQMTLRIVVDVSSVEIFVDEGRNTFSSLVFSGHENRLDITSGKGTILKTLDIWDIF